MGPAQQANWDPDMGYVQVMVTGDMNAHSKARNRRATRQKRPTFWVMLTEDYSIEISIFNHYPHATYLDHGEIIYSPFPVRCPHGGGTLQVPLCPPPRPVPRRCRGHQGNYKGKRQMKPTTPHLRSP